MWSQPQRTVQPSYRRNGLSNKSVFAGDCISLNQLGSFRHMKGTPGSDALIVLGRMPAMDLGQFHFDVQILSGEPDGFGDSQIRIALAAARATNLADGMKALGGHQIA